MLSPVKETGTLLGAVTEAAAQQSGLRAGTPVVMGGGDVQLGCLGLGWCAPGKPRYSAALSGSRWSTCRRCVPIRR
ncbi:FGGY family carbohydrate kinase [Klebsiella pneumoniae]